MFKPAHEVIVVGGSAARTAMDWWMDWWKKAKKQKEKGQDKTESVCECGYRAIIHIGFFIGGRCIAIREIGSKKIGLVEYIFM